MVGRHHSRRPIALWLLPSASHHFSAGAFRSESFRLLSFVKAQNDPPLAAIAQPKLPFRTRPHRGHLQRLSILGENVQSPSDSTACQNLHMIWIEPDAALTILANIEAAIEVDYLGSNFVSQSGKPTFPTANVLNYRSQASFVLDPAK